jgi:hypothetical protein
MSYRDDRDADQARIADLEHELVAAKRRVAELEGKQSQALVLASGGALATTGEPNSAAAKWFGAPLRLSLERRFEGAYPVDKLEDLLEVIQRITKDRGRTELLRSSLTWWSGSPERGTGPFMTLTISVKDGATTLIANDRLGPLAGVIFGAIGGGVGGGAIMAPIAASIAMPILAPVFAIGWLGGFYAITRKLYKRSATKRAQQLQTLFDAVAAEIEAALRTSRGDSAT